MEISAINAISGVIPKSFYRTVTGSGYYNFSIYDSSIKAGEYYVGFWTDAQGTQKHLVFPSTAGKLEFGDANTLKQGSDIIAIQVKSKN